MTNHEKTIGVTGHRKITHDYNSVLNFTKQSIQHLAENKGYTKLITGMAFGFDLLVADACIDLNFPFVAALAYKDQSKFWKSSKSRKHFDRCLEQAAETVVVSEGDWDNYKYLIRDTWIVENSDAMICYWAGVEKSGTGFTVNEAVRLNKPIVNIYNLL